MNRMFPLAVAAIVFAIPGTGRGDDKDDVKLMNGVWLPETAELAGKKFPDETRKAMKLELNGDAYTLKIGGTADKGTVKWNPTAKIKTLDIVGTEGPNKGKTILAIYEVTKDELKICYDLGGKERPKAFETKADTKLFLVTYKREKPKRGTDPV